MLSLRIFPHLHVPLNDFQEIQLLIAMNDSLNAENLHLNKKKPPLQHICRRGGSLGYVDETARNRG
jgi:hypothetical protein